MKDEPRIEENKKHEQLNIFRVDDVGRTMTIDEKFSKDAINFIKEAYMHFKPIGAAFNGKKWLQEDNMASGAGVVIEDDKEEFMERFVDSILAHRHWGRKIY